MNEGITVKRSVPLSPPHVIVIVYGTPPTPAGPVPTTNRPVALCLYSCPLKLVTTVVGAPVNEHDVPLAAVPSPVDLKVITSPYRPEDAAKARAACAILGGVTTEKIETNNAEVRSSTINREP